MVRRFPSLDVSQFKLNGYIAEGLVRMIDVMELIHGKEIISNIRHYGTFCAHIGGCTVGGKALEG